MKSSKLLSTVFLIILTSCNQNVVDDKPIQVVDQSASIIENWLSLINNGIDPLIWKGELAVLGGDNVKLRRDKEGYYVRQQQIHPGITLLDQSGVLLQPDDCDWEILIILDERKLAVVRKKTTVILVFPIPKSE